MYLIKPGYTYTGNNYTYQSRAEAIERLYYAVMNFLSNNDVKKLPEKLEKYTSNHADVSIKDKTMLKKSVEKIKAWVESMQPRTKPDSKVMMFQERGRQSDGDMRLIELKRQKYVDSLSTRNSVHAFLNFYEIQVNRLLYEGDKLIPIAHLYNWLKPNQRTQFDDLIKKMDEWVQMLEEAIKPYINMDKRSEVQP